MLRRGELVRFLYRLGRHAASGVLTISGDGCTAPRHMFVLRRGSVVVTEGELARRTLIARLVRLAAIEPLTVVFDGGVAAYPPGAMNSVALATWARTHLEAQLDGALADALARDLAGVRVHVRTELAPEPADDADRRMLAAMDRPRRLDQIGPLARTPRFRMLAFLHFLRAVDALVLEGVAADRRTARGTLAPPDSRRTEALRMLGLGEDADLDAIKRAYRRLARELHPDLQPGADADRRRALERKLVSVTEAYESLAGN